MTLRRARSLTRTVRRAAQRQRSAAGRGARGGARAGGPNGTGTRRFDKQLVEILVVAEDHVPSHVDQEALWRRVRARQASSLVSLRACVVLSETRAAHPPQAQPKAHLVDERPVAVAALVDPRGGAKTGGAGAHDEYANLGA